MVAWNYLLCVCYHEACLGILWLFVQSLLALHFQELSSLWRITLCRWFPNYRPANLSQMNVDQCSKSVQVVALPGNLMAEQGACL